MKRFNVIYVDKFGREWSSIAVGHSQAAVVMAFQLEHPDCYSIRAYEN